MVLPVKPTLSTKKDYAFDLHHLRHIALGGCGAAGVAPIGGVICLDDYGLLDSVEVFSGTSSGSILAAPLALGYRGQELKDIVMRQNFSAFLTPSYYELSRIRPSLEGYGLFSGHELRRWINLMLAQRLGDAKLTFAKLQEYKDYATANDLNFFKARCLEAAKRFTDYQKIFRGGFSFDFMPQLSPKNPTLSGDELGDAAKKLMMFARKISDLNVVASEVTKGTDDASSLVFNETVFNATTMPNVDIAQAVRASAAYPFFFRHAKIDGKYYSDGGLTNLIPLNILKDTIPDHQSLALHARYLSGTDCDFPILPSKPSNKIKQRIVSFAKDAIHYIHVYRFALRSRVERDTGGWVASINDAVARVTEAYSVAFPSEKDAPSVSAEKSIDGAQKFAEIVFGKTAVRKAWQALEEITPLFWNNPQNSSRVIELDRGNVGSTDFFIGNAEKEWLMQSGYQGMRAVIERQLGAAEKKSNSMPDLPKEPNKSWAKNLPSTPENDSKAGHYKHRPRDGFGRKQ